MMRFKTLRIYLGLFLILSYSLIVEVLFFNSKLKNLIFEGNILKIKPDWVILYSRRFTELRDYIPFNCSIGYISDGPSDDLPIEGSDNMMGRYFIAQNTLAPIKVVLGFNNLEFVLGDFTTSDSILRYTQDSLKPLVIDRENNVVLYKKIIK